MEMNAQDDEVSLLDLMLVVAENIKLLILGSLLAGFLALGVAYVLPQKYISNAILALPTPTSPQMPVSSSAPSPAQVAADQIATILVSPLVLDAVDQNLRLSNGQSGNVARNPVAGQVKVSVGKKDLLIRLDVTAATPEASQNMANAVIDSWLKSTTPNGQDRADLEKRLDYAQKSLDVVTGLLERLAAGDADKLNILRPRGEAAVTFVALAELQARHLADVLSISRSLQGQSRDVVLQPPTLPTEPAPSKKALMATLAALGTGFALLLFVFMRSAWRGARPRSCTKADSAAGCAWVEVIRGFGIRCAEPNTGRKCYE